MRYDDFDQFLDKGQGALRDGPVALIFAEDLVEVDSTVTHHRKAGFREIVLFAPDEVKLSEDTARNLHRVPYATLAPGAVPAAVNRITPRAAGQWVYYCYNAEYLFFPFCDTRSVGEMLTFHAEERRAAMLTYVIDLYAADLNLFPDAVSVEDARLDRTGYYALARHRGGQAMERQHDFYGGLRWRFEEHVPADRRRIDRVALFRAREGLTLRDDHTFDDEEMNTYACPWHHNLTAAICSFRTAKALRSNPGSREAISDFRWPNSTRFNWTPRQLLDLGLMEPGQWF